MRVLLDESIPRDLARELSGHEVQTMPARGWAGLQNGDLLRRASAEYDAFVTVDANLPYQQTLTQFDIGVVLLRAHTNRMEHLRPLIPAILTALDGLTPGQLRRVGA